MSDFLKDFLAQRRAADQLEADSAGTESILMSMDSALAALAENSTKQVKDTKKAVGASSTQVALAREYAVAYAERSDEQLGALWSLHDSQKAQARTLNKHLIALNRTLAKAVAQGEESDEHLARIAKYLKPDTTRSKRDSSAAKAGSAESDRRKDKQGNDSNKPGLVDSLFDMFEGDDDGRRRRKRGRGKGRGRRGRSIGMPGTPSPTAGAANTSWWSKVKEKIPGLGSAGEAASSAAKGGGAKGLWNSIPKNVKVAGTVGTALTALSLAPTLLSDDPTIDKPKETAKTAGSIAGGVLGWKAGAVAGGAAGAFGGPAAPVTVPIGALVGGLLGAWGGSELGDSIAELATDSFRNASEISAEMRKTFASYFPQLGVMAQYFGQAIDRFSEYASGFIGDLEKKFEEWGGNFKEGAKYAYGVASNVSRQAVEVAKETATKAADAVVTAPSRAAEFVKNADARVGGYARKSVDAILGESKGLGKGRYTDEEQQSIAQARQAGEKFRLGSGLTAEQKAKITATAQKHGLDPNYMMAKAQMESGGNPNAVSPTGATGMYQFIGRTAKNYGLKNRFDEDANIEAAAKFTKDNAKALEAAGIKATPENLYLAHQQGPGGAVQIINAAKKGTAVSEEVRKNMQANYGDLSPAEYLAKNNKAWAAAQKKAETTYEGTYNKVDSTKLAANSKEEGPPNALGHEKVKVAQADTAEKAPVPASPTSRDRVAAEAASRKVTPSAEAAPVVAKAPSVPPKPAEPAKDPKGLANAVKMALAPSEESLKNYDTTGRLPGLHKDAYKPTTWASTAPEDRVYARKESQPMVDAQAPEEVKPVQVANAAEMTPNIQLPPLDSGGGLASSNSSNSTVPTLDSLPLQITDFGLMLLNIGRV